jgi:hypothetical protein
VQPLRQETPTKEALQHRPALIRALLPAGAATAIQLRREVVHPQPEVLHLLHLLPILHPAEAVPVPLPALTGAAAEGAAVAGVVPAEAAAVAEDVQVAAAGNKNEN